MASEPLTDVLQETVALFDGPGEPLTTPEVADLLDLGRRSTYERLERLVEHGRLETKKVGANARVWWLPPISSNEATPPEARTEFETLINAVEEYAIFTLDAEGHVRSWNPGAERIKGYDADEILGDHFSTFYTEGDCEAGVPERNLGDAVSQRSVEDEGWRLRKDGTRFWANVTITAIRDAEGEVTGFAKVTRDMTARHEYEEQLRQERDLVERIFDTAPVGIGVLSKTGDLTRANERARELLSVTDTSGFSVGDRSIFDAEGDPVPPEERPFARVLDTGEPVSDWQCQIEHPTDERRWLSVNAAPLEESSGEITHVVFAGDDVTPLKEQARRLERQRDDLESELEDVFERVDDAFFALDDGWRFTYVNDQAADLVRLSTGELIGERVWEVLPEIADGHPRETAERAMETGESFEFEFYSELLDRWFEIRGYPSETGLSVYVRDITDEKHREMELHRYETTVETVWDGITTLDSENRFVMVNEAFCEMTGYDRAEVIGEHVTLILDEDTLAEAAALHQQVERGDIDRALLEYDLRTAAGGTITVEAQFGPCEFEDGSTGGTGVIRDITERKERERRLTRYETIVETVNDGIYTVDEAGRFTMVNDAYTEMTGYSRRELLESDVSLVVDDQTIETARDYEAELRAGNRETVRFEADLLTKDGDSIRGEGVFAMLTTRPGAVERVGVVRDITDRVERERELERQRERLAAINNLNEVARGIITSVLDQSTRAEIERSLCELITATDSYEIAWVGDLNASHDVIEPQVSAGNADELGEGQLSIDPNDAPCDDPVVRAVSEQQVHVATTVSSDAERIDWSELVGVPGIQSTMAIPLRHEGTLYGVLCLHATRDCAFTDEEREVLEGLGEVVGHAIAAIERKQALMNDEVTEIQFTVTGLLEAIGYESDMHGTISFDRTVPIGDGGHIVYGTVDEEAVEVLHALTDRHPDIGGVTVADRTNDPIRFQLRVSDPPIISIVASNGGYVRNAKVESGDLRMTVYLPPTVAASRVISAIEGTYSGVTLLRQRQITRDDPSALVHRTISEDLTDRQRSALEAAVYSGFFEWPREMSGHEVAASLDVTPPTFHQHLRKAQKKVFESLYSGTAPV